MYDKIYRYILFLIFTLQDVKFYEIHNSLLITLRKYSNIGRESENNFSKH